MIIAITGATGFIGKGLAESLSKEDHDVIALSRNPAGAKAAFGSKIRALEWSGHRRMELVRELDGIDAFVNLAGENIGSSLWTKSKRKKIAESRIQTGHLISELLRLMKNPPKVLIQASAVGYYGTRGEEILTEQSEQGKGFLPQVAAEWESSAAAVESSGVRCAITRSGVVFASNGGAFPKLALPYKLHFGTILGSGEQWMPWIHYEDEINAICFLITNSHSAGIYNLVAPFPARMRDLCKAMGPTLFRMPSTLLKLLLGEMAEETILVSQCVVPERLLKDGFEFKFRTIEDAVENIYRAKKLYI